MEGNEEALLVAPSPNGQYITYICPSDGVYSVCLRNGNENEKEFNENEKEFNENENDFNKNEKECYL